MRLGDLISFEGSSYPLYPALIALFGLETAVFLSRIIWYQQDKDSWIEKSMTAIQQQTGLTPHLQRKARELLESSGIIEQHHLRLEHRLRFRVLDEALKREISTFSKTAPIVKNEFPQVNAVNMATSTPLTSSIDQDLKDIRKEIRRAFAPPSLEEVKQFCATLGLPESDGESFYWGKVGNGWKNGRNPIVSWKGTIRQWKAAGYMPSQKHAQATKPKKGFAQL